MTFSPARLVLVGALAALAGAALARPQPRHAGVPVAAMPAGNAVRGQTLYAVCMGCHSIDDNDIGPRHRGVVGRTAGSVAGYAYSPALKAAKLVWTPVQIDRWLQGPAKMVPGTKMFFSVAKPQDRADIIAYLATQK